MPYLVVNTHYRFKLGSSYAFVLSGYDVMKESMVDKAEYFSDRPSWLPTIKDLDRDAGKTPLTHA